MEQVNHTTPNRSRTGGTFGCTKPFGAIIITRPQFAIPQLSIFRVYTINPGIVKSYLGPTPSVQTLIKCTTAADSTSDIRLLYNVNELRIRNSSISTHSKGVAELWWTEAESGNEFLLAADAWTQAP